MVEIPKILNREMVMKELTFDSEGRWAVPALNRMSVVDPNLPKHKVIIKDDTFRESTNMPGASPTNAQKLALAKKLESVGVTELRDVRIVVGHVGAPGSQQAKDVKTRGFTHVGDVTLVRDAKHEDACPTDRLAPGLEGGGHLADNMCRHRSVDFARKFDKARRDVQRLHLP